jgi:hypothetical protein
VSRVKTTVDCRNAFTTYYSNWLSGFRIAMNDYAKVIQSIAANEVGPSFMDRAADRQQFFDEMERRSLGVRDGGYLLAEYEALLAEYDRDVASVDDSYDRATGCNGYPLPEGLAPSSSCPTRSGGQAPLRN